MTHNSYFLVVKLLAPVIIISFLIRQSLSFPTSNGTHAFCGSLIFNDTEKLDLYSGSELSPEDFEKVYNKLNSVQIKIEAAECVIDICGYPTIPQPGNSKPLNAGCAKFSAPNSSILFNNSNVNIFQVGFEASSISCGCKKGKSSDCKSQLQCNKNNETITPNNNDTCAILYSELSCEDCYFDGIVLGHKGEYKTGNGALIRSAFVQKDCVLTQIGFGYSEYDPEVSPIQKFIPFEVPYYNSSPRINPSYTRRGDDFSCICPKLIPSTLPPSILTSDPENPAIKWTLISLALFCIIVMSSACITWSVWKKYRHSWSNNKPTQPPNLISQETIAKFHKNTFNNLGEDASPGVVQAVNRPFDKEKEIPREWLDFNLADVSSILGHGVFGIVYKGTLLTDGRNVAIKTLKPFSEAGYFQSILNELKVHAFIGHHPHIVDFIGASTSAWMGGEVYIVLELCSNGNLEKYLKNMETNLSRTDLVQHSELANYYRFDIRTIELSQEVLDKMYKWSKEIASGMEFLVEKQVLHVDLATRNVFLTENLECKIGDFGLSRKLYDKEVYMKRKHSQEPFPMRQSAPESLTEKKFSEKSDIWAYGVTLWEIFSLGMTPYVGLDYPEIVQFLHSGQRLACPTSINEEIYNETMLRCWNDDMQSRPTFTEMRIYFETLLANNEN